MRCSHNTWMDEDVVKYVALQSFVKTPHVATLQELFLILRL